LTNLKQERGFEDFTDEDVFDHLINTAGLNNKMVVAFPEKYYIQIRPIIRKIGGWATIKDITAQAKVSDYIVYPVWEDENDLEVRFETEKVGSIQLRGVDLYNVYRRITIAEVDERKDNPELKNE
jgi:hypothetical protein